MAGVSNSDDSSSFEWESDGSSSFEWEDTTGFNAAGAGSSAGPSRRDQDNGCNVHDSVDVDMSEDDEEFLEYFETLDKVDFLVEKGIPKEEAQYAVTSTYWKDLSLSGLEGLFSAPQTRGDGYRGKDVEDQDNGCNVHDSGDVDMSEEEFLGYFETLDKVDFLVEKGIPKEEAQYAVTSTYWKDLSLSDLEGLFSAPQTRGDGYRGKDVEDSSFGGRNNGRSMDGNRTRRERFGRFEHGQCSRPVSRSLPADAFGPPFFYYENSSLAKSGVWKTISASLYDIEPEFVDSEDFSAVRRKRCCIHNLPVENRSYLSPTPPKTIQLALPHTRPYWPSWDPRKKLNTLQTREIGAADCGSINDTLRNTSGSPPSETKARIMAKCNKWNLIWVGKNRLAPLQPTEMELLLGYPKDHTRVCVNHRKRRRSLASAFQVDTVAYFLSPLKALYPQGIKVLSLFSGIGGAEVALHRIGIPILALISVERCVHRRSILSSWWEQTEQVGDLYEIHDVRQEQLILGYVEALNGVDLVIGGSPWKNLLKDGLENDQTSLFYNYESILKSVMAFMRPSR